jgi:dienelactone hydrolase
VKIGRLIVRVLLFGLLAFIVFVAVGLLWLRWEAHQPREDWFSQRKGQLVEASTEPSLTPHGQLTEKVGVTSDSGLSVLLRLIRDEEPGAKRPVLIVLGGHRTGSDAVDLFGDVGERAVVGVDYPYDGPEKVRGLGQVLKTIPLARQAMLDTVPAVSLVLDWLLTQSWADAERVVIIGASLGVPFAATAAARDDRILGAMLVHGAADNRLWLEAQLERRVETGLMHYPLSVVLHWLAYGPALNTGERIGTIAPRPVVIIGARDDERTPSGQAELLFELAGEPRRLRFTEGAHIEPDRREIIEALLRIADEELAFLGAMPVE